MKVARRVLVEIDGEALHCACISALLTHECACVFSALLTHECTVCISCIGDKPRVCVCVCVLCFAYA